MLPLVQHHVYIINALSHYVTMTTSCFQCQYFKSPIHSVTCMQACMYVCMYVCMYRIAENFRWTCPTHLPLHYRNISRINFHPCGKDCCRLYVIKGFTVICTCLWPKKTMDLNVDKWSNLPSPSYLHITSYYWLRWLILYKPHSCTFFALQCTYIVIVTMHEVVFSLVITTYWSA